MSTPEELLNDQDPDYVSAVSIDEPIQQKIYEENARNATAKKITAIIEKEFAQEIDLKEKEVLQIQERLHKTLKGFHLLRYAIITNFYNRKQCQNPQAAGTTKQTRIHPAVKSLLGKSPKSVNYTDLAVPSTSTDPRFSFNNESPVSNAPITESNSVKTEEDADKHDATSQGEKRKLPDDESRPRKVPRYIPPNSSTPEKTSPSRGNSQKIRKRIIIGNISRWIPQVRQEDKFTHKWRIYVRSDKDDDTTNISSFVSKVRFFLHPSYRPHDVVEVTTYPFHLSRHGWGEFPVRIQLHFKNTLNRPVDIIHHLKLDRTYTGLLTLGSETLVDIWIHTTETRNFELNKSNKSIESAFNASIKIESGSSESIRKQSTMNSIETLQMNTSEEILVKKELSNAQVHSEVQSNLVLNLVEKLKNKIKIESNDDVNIFSNKNESNLDEISYCVRHDHNYVNRQYFNSNHYTEREGNITIEHFIESDCVATANSANDEEKKFDVQIASHKFNDDVQSSNSCQSLATSNAMENDLQVNAASQQKKNQENFLSLESSRDANKFLQARNSKNNDISQISKNITTKDTTKINGFCKSFDTLLDRFNSLQKTANNANSHLKPLQISIPPPNVFPSSINKRMLLLKDTKSVPVNVTNIISSKSSENPRKLVDGDLKFSIVRDGNIAKLNVRIPQTVSILKKPPNSNNKMNARQKGTGSDNEKPAVLTLKNSNTLLLNVNETVPILKIADSHDPRYSYNNNLAKATKGDSSTSRQEIMSYVKPENKMQRTKITLGKDRYKIQSKRELYEATLHSIGVANIVDTEALIRFIIRRLPMITRNARDPEYKLIHPYACCSEEEYFAHNIGKQRALEWNRAKTIRNFLRVKMIPSDQLWSTKEILLWVRLHGYTPSRKVSGTSEAVTMSDTKKLPDTATPTVAVSTTCRESIALQKWLETCQEESSQSMDACIEDEEIDVDSIEESSCRSTIDRRKSGDNRNSDSSTDSKLIPLELDESLLPFHNFVCDTTRDIGIKIGSEEIVPGVLYNAASRVMMRVVECFVEDLTRRSLAKAWEGNSGNECPEVITLNDVRNALLSREEFDIFTNEGLASMQQSSAAESSSL